VEQQDLFQTDARMENQATREATRETIQPSFLRNKFIDTREPWELREKLIETGWEQKTLYYGDMIFQTHNYTRVIVTRKSTNDLLTSINEVWAKQLEMILDYNLEGHNIILIEGSWTNIRPNVVLGGSGISYLTWDGIWNYLRRWQDKGFTLELTTSWQHTVNRLNKLYALYQKPYSLSAMTHRFTDDRVLSMPSGTRGKTGQKVLDELGSIQAVANASVEKLLQIEGIGQKKADLIFNHMRKTSVKRLDKAT